MKKVERIVARLSDNQLEVFRGLQHCLNAAKFVIDECISLYSKKECDFISASEFIKATIHELEQRKKLEYQMWSNIKKEHSLSDDEFNRLEIDEDTGDIYLLSKEYSNIIDIRKFNMMWNRG